ncbi:MAG: alanine--glyoxylate aminotransferase family protein [Candidatus Omnitrophica bacterium]|nr:alanine--glyoxylate aminotransferase family protein [Candidatus Omnitrophota bacterium]
MKRQLLMTPGPTPVPKAIMDKMAEPIIHHRTPEYREIFKSVCADLKTVFKTRNDCCVLTSSGTGAMEASVVNMLSPGDKAIAVRGGKFGERYYDICKAYGVDVIPVDIKWGTAPDPKEIKKILDDNPGIKAVYTELCETSTATVYDIKALGNVIKDYSAIFVVDAISGLAADDLQTDTWNVDIAVSGSQKALMLPPGLSFLSVSEKAWGMAKNSRLPKYYYDLNKYRKSLDQGDTPFTPAITLTIGLKRALEAIKKKGIDNILKECKGMAKQLRNEAEKLGFEIFSKSPSNAVTALKVPAGVDGALLVKAIKTRGITVAGGQAELKGKIIRVSHMGAVTENDITKTVGVLKEALKELNTK